MHKLIIEKVQRPENKVVSRQVEEFYSIYNLERRKFEIDDAPPQREFYIRTTVDKLSKAA